MWSFESKEKKMSKSFFIIVGFIFTIQALLESIVDFYFAKNHIYPVLSSADSIFNAILLLLTSITLSYWTYIIVKNKSFRNNIKQWLLKIIGFGLALFILYSSCYSLYYAFVGHPPYTQIKLIYNGIINGLMGLVFIYFTFLICKIKSAEKINWKNFLFGLIGYGLASALFFAGMYFFFVHTIDSQPLTLPIRIIAIIINLLTASTLTYLTFLMRQKNLVLSKNKKHFITCIGFGSALWLSLNCYSLIETNQPVGTIIFALIFISVFIYWTYRIIRKKIHD